MPKLAPDNAEKVMVIRPVTDRITTLSLPFARHGLAHIGGRATIVKLSNGDLAVFSPVELTETVQEWIKTEIGGRVRYLIAPDIEHHIFLSQWYSAYPGCTVIGPDQLAEKREKKKETAGVPINVVFKPDTEVSVDAVFDADFSYVYVPDHRNKEIVFFFKPDRTLIQADLIFNLPVREQYSKVANFKPNLPTRLMGRLFSGESGKTGLHKKLIWLISRRNPARFGAAMEAILAFDFDRMIPCHGDVVETGAKEIVRDLLSAALPSPAKAGPQPTAPAPEAEHRPEHKPEAQPLPEVEVKPVGPAASQPESAPPAAQA